MGTAALQPMLVHSSATWAALVLRFISRMISPSPFALIPCHPSPNHSPLLDRVGTEEDSGQDEISVSSTALSGSGNGSRVFPSRGLVVGHVGWRWLLPPSSIKLRTRGFTDSPLLSLMPSTGSGLLGLGQALINAGFCSVGYGQRFCLTVI